MEIVATELPDVLLLVCTAHRDRRGFFSRTFDARVVRDAGLAPERFVQDSQSRSYRGVLRGLHGRGGAGEGKLVRCSRGAIYDVVVDARPDSATFGRWQGFRLDDVTLRQVYVPPGCLHGFQVLSDVADVCYRIDREHDASEDVAVRYDDPDLGVEWPARVRVISERDRSAGSWSDLRSELLAGAAC